VSLSAHRSSYSRTLFSSLLDLSFCILDSHSTFAFLILHCQLSIQYNIVVHLFNFTLWPRTFSCLVQTQIEFIIMSSHLSPRFLALQLRSFLVSLSSLSSFCRASVRSYTYPQFILARFNLVVIVRRKMFLSYRFNSPHPVPARLSIHFQVSVRTL
jgi:hypothetical protein